MTAQRAGAPREQEPADGRAGDVRDLERDRALRERLHEDLLRHERDGVNARPAGAPIAPAVPNTNASTKNGHTSSAPGRDRE